MYRSSRRLRVRRARLARRLLQSQGPSWNSLIHFLDIGDLATDVIFGVAVSSSIPRKDISFEYEFDVKVDLWLTIRQTDDVKLEYWLSQQARET